MQWRGAALRSGGAAVEHAGVATELQCNVVVLHAGDAGLQWNMPVGERAGGAAVQRGVVLRAGAAELHCNTLVGRRSCCAAVRPANGGAVAALQLAALTGSNGADQRHLTAQDPRNQSADP